eukprot:1467575-Amphidinium_carterae.1
MAMEKRVDLRRSGSACNLCKREKAILAAKARGAKWLCNSLHMQGNASEPRCWLSSEPQAHALVGLSGLVSRQGNCGPPICQAPQALEI